MKIRGFVFGCLLAGFAVDAHAATMDFFGLRDGERPGAFYDGGAGAQGSVGGPQNDFGVTFNNAIARCNIQLDCEQREQDILVFTNAPTLAANDNGLNYFVNVEGGFTGDVSFTFATPQAGVAEFWSGVGGTGIRLGSITLGTDGCPDLDHCAFRNTSGMVDRGLIAHSISFVGVSPEIFAIDNLSLNLADSPISGAPEPAAWALALTGFGLAGASLRRRRRGALS